MSRGVDVDFSQPDSALHKNAVDDLQMFFDLAQIPFSIDQHSDTEVIKQIGVWLTSKGATIDFSFLYILKTVFFQLHNRGTFRSSDVQARTLNGEDRKN